MLAPDVKDIRDSSNRLMSSFAQSCEYSEPESSIKYVQDSLIKQLKLSQGASQIPMLRMTRGDFPGPSSNYKAIKIDESNIKIEFEEHTTVTHQG